MALDEWHCLSRCVQIPTSDVDHAVSTCSVRTCAPWQATDANFTCCFPFNTNGTTASVQALLLGTPKGKGFQAAVWVCVFVSLAFALFGFYACHTDDS